MAPSTLLSTIERDQPASVIDDDHLWRMTLGDSRLEREVLEIFVRQIAVMLGRIAAADPALAGASAHTLKGSARGIGAWRLARAAELLEQAAAASHDRAALANAVEQLKAAAGETSAVIDARLGGPPPAGNL